jgi:hypothetical protein
MDQPTDTLFQTYNRGLYKITGSEMSEDIMNAALASDSSANNSSSVTLPADSVGSGVSTATTEAASGSYQSGKKTFTNDDVGFIIGVDPTDGYAKFYIGNTSKYINWDGQNLVVVGGLSVSQLDIPDTVTANSFHVDSSGDAWWGATAIGSAVAKILNTGAATFSNMTITGGSVATGVMDKALMSWTTSVVFSSTDNDTISWGTGTITMQDGTSYSISAGNTGNMVALTYIYLDLAVSVTVLQTTTTFSTAVGNGKILVAVAQNHTAGASVIPGGGQQPIINGTDQITAASVLAANMSVATLSAISANMGTITSGTITGGTIQTASSGTRFVLTSTSMQGINSGGDVIFEIKISGADAGDVIMGKVSSGAYAMWDNSAGTFNIYGSNVGPDVQIFTTSGTYTKPVNATNIVVTAVGAGGGGGNSSNGTHRGTGGGGGGGGALNSAQFMANLISETVAVTVSNATGAQTDGVDTTFGAYLTANGGKLGGDGQDFSAGIGGAGGAATGAGIAGGGGGNGGDGLGSNYWGGGGGGAAGSGGGNGSGGAAGTTSTLVGAGGDQNVAGSPYGGGGGGASYSYGTSPGSQGAGGYCIVTTYRS